MAVTAEAVPGLTVTVDGRAHLVLYLLPRRRGPQQARVTEEPSCGICEAPLVWRAGGWSCSGCSHTPSSEALRWLGLALPRSTPLVAGFGYPPLFVHVKALEITALTGVTRAASARVQHRRRQPLPSRVRRPAFGRACPLRTAGPWDREGPRLTTTAPEWWEDGTRTTPTLRTAGPQGELDCWSIPLPQTRGEHGSRLPPRTWVAMESRSHTSLSAWSRSAHPGQS